MRKIRTAGFALILLAVLAVFWLSKRGQAPRLDPPAILLQVQQLNQLTTVKFTIQKVVGLREQKQPVGEEAILLIIQASVQAGIDLSSLGAKDVTVSPDGVVTMRLPPPKILNVAIDEKATQVWDRSKTWWAPWLPYSLDLEQRARLAGLEAVNKSALDMGILLQAERNAETSIRGLLGLAGVKSVVIIPAKAD